jgi:uncharacterized membrane protein
MKSPQKKPQSGQVPLPPDKGGHESTSSHEVVVATTQQFSGPLPHPDALKQYDQLVPGAAKSIVDSFVKEGDHRRSCEKRESIVMETWSDGDIRLQKRGQIFGFILGVIGIGGGLWAGINGAPATGSIIGGGSLAAIVTAFLRQRPASKEDTKAVAKS